MKNIFTRRYIKKKWLFVKLYWNLIFKKETEKEYHPFIYEDINEKEKINNKR